MINLANIKNSKLYITIAKTAKLIAIALLVSYFCLFLFLGILITTVKINGPFNTGWAANYLANKINQYSETLGYEVKIDQSNFCWDQTRGQLSLNLNGIKAYKVNKNKNNEKNINNPINLPDLHVLLNISGFVSTKSLLTLDVAKFDPNSYNDLLTFSLNKSPSESKIPLQQLQDTIWEVAKKTINISIDGLELNIPLGPGNDLATSQNVSIKPKQLKFHIAPNIIPTFKKQKIAIFKLYTYINNHPLEINAKLNFKADGSIKFDDVVVDRVEIQDAALFIPKDLRATSLDQAMNQIIGSIKLQGSFTLNRQLKVVDFEARLNSKSLQLPFAELDLNNINLNIRYQNQEVSVDQSSFILPEINCLFTLDGKYNLSDDFFLFNLQPDSIEYSKLGRYWSSLAPIAKLWVDQHLKEALVKKLTIRKEKITGISLDIEAENAKLDYMQNIPSLKIPNATISIGENAVKISAPKSIFDPTKQEEIEEIKSPIVGKNVVAIINYPTTKSPDITLDLGFDGSGRVAEILQMIERHIANTQQANQPSNPKTKDDHKSNQPKQHPDFDSLKNMDLRGLFEGKINLAIPLSSSKPKPIDIRANGHIKDLEIIDFGFYGIENIKANNVDLVMTSDSLDLSGNNITTNTRTFRVIKINHNLNAKHPDTIMLETDTNVEEINTWVPIPKLKQFWQKDTVAKITITQNKQQTQVTANFDLTKSTIQIPLLNIAKTINQPGILELNVLVKDDNNFEVLSYQLKIPSFKIKGNAEINLKDDEILVEVENCSFFNNDIQAIFAQKYGNIDIELTGDRIDLSNFEFASLPKFLSKKQPNTLDNRINIVAKVREVIGHNNINLADSSITFAYNSLQNNQILIQSLFQNQKGYFTFFHDNEQFALVSNNLEYLSKFLGFSKNFLNGRIEAKGQYDSDQQKFLGYFLADKINFNNSPFASTIIKIISLTSIFSSPAQVLQGGGLYISNASCDLLYQNGIIYFDKCIADGPSLNWLGTGLVNTSDGQVNFSGSIMPKHIFYTIGSMISKFWPKLGYKMMNNTERNNFKFTIDAEGKEAISSQPLSMIMPWFVGQAFKSYEPAYELQK